MDFRESLTLRLPDLKGSDVTSFVESHYGKEDRSHDGLIIEIAAIHEGMTANFNYYSKEALTAAIDSWTSPYSRPVIINHNTLEKPLGRVMNAEMRQEEDGSAYVLLQVAISDPHAVEMVLDGRYLTGSVGGKANEAVCSICKTDWQKASPHEMPCRHERGKVYKGKLAFLEMRDINFKEYSFVNVPADERSGVRSLSSQKNDVYASAESGEDLPANAARLFSINLNEQEIFELSLGESSNILSGLRNKQSRPLYMQTKGAFLSALAQDVPTDSKESDLEGNKIDQEEEDILAVAESLSDDLAAEPVTEAEDVAAEEGQEDEPAVAEADTEIEEEEEPAVITEDELAEPEVEESAESDEPEALETVSATDEDVEEASEEGAEEEEPAPAEVEETDSSDQERISVLESRVAELEALESQLLEQNDKLKVALKRGLAERVVDNKIALGLEESADRSSLVEDHFGRTASSLADSLRDLSSMSAVPAGNPAITESIPEIEKSSGAVEDEGATLTESTPQEESDPEETLVGVFVDTLMGRRSL